MAAAPIMSFTCFSLLLLFLLFNACLTIIALPHQAENAGDDVGADSIQKGIEGTAGEVGAGTRSLAAHKNVKMKEATKGHRGGEASSEFVIGGNKEDDENYHRKKRNGGGDFVAFNADYHSPRHHPPKNN